ncbi:MAG: hydantoinase/oxoprolinase family protein [Candidatus Eremiobacteraeota bacterium]|nr:hydantoinase/oxoprolinase family protein [Candidatus Eremiobacteraeota bacterium]
MPNPALRVGIDVGGTFTDLVALDAVTGAVTALKAASTPQAPELGVLNALRELFARYVVRPKIEWLSHSTTIATNALLGQINLELPHLAFVTTHGFRDVIEIGRQNRSEVYNLFVERPKPLVAREDRIGVRERMDHRGEVLEALNDAEIDRVVGEVRKRNVDAVAIGFLHSYVNDAHERRIAEALASAMPHLAITRSSEVDPEYREYERFSTTVVNAALLPIVRRYIERLAAALRDEGVVAPLYVMQSNGGMATAARAAERPATIVESGPAAGVIATADLARRLQVAKVLSFDMGGTTAKAGTIVDGVVQVIGEFEAAGSSHSGRAVKGSGYPVRFPFVDLAEISAGGGTIAWIDDGGALRVGPLSAGADPGPACYGRSDGATVTDANVVLGRLHQTHLVGGTFPIDARRSRAAVETLALQLGLSIEATAAGIITLVDNEMAKVLRIVTVERGLDPREFAMVAFGGNGPLHACALADELGISRVLVPRNPGVFSAHGLLVAEMRASFLAPLMREASSLEYSELETLFERLEIRGRAALRDQGVDERRMTFVREYDARYRGQSFELDIADGGSMTGILERFHAKHERRYGYAVRDERVELVNARLTAVGTVESPADIFGFADVLSAASDEPAARRVFIEGEFCDVPVYSRTSVPSSLAGPALIEQYDACTYVPPGWLARNGDVLRLERRA